jgi:hypothetical protein
MEFRLTLNLDNAEARWEDGSLNEQALRGYIEQASRKAYEDHVSGVIIDGNGSKIGEYATWDD